MYRSTRLRALTGLLVIAATAAVAAGFALTQNEKDVVSALAPGLRDGDRRVIERLLDSTRGQPAIGQRMKTISAQLLGSPYLAHPLIGSPAEPEQFVVRLDRFDCVTFLETVLALGGANDVNGFLDRLRRVRYEDGVVSYRTRLHYMTDWNKSNVRRGFLQDLTSDVGTAEQTKTLNVVAGFEPRTATLRYFPRQQISGVSKWLQDGDLIYFVSGRQSLDVFHVGLVFREGEQVMLRHASLSKNKVIDQKLTDFLQVNRASGFIVARPIESRIELKLHVPPASPAVTPGLP